MIELGGYRAQAELDVAQAFAMRQLGEGHAEPLIPAGETPQLLICSIARHTLLKFAMRKKLHQLRKHRSAKIHFPLFSPANFKSFLCQYPLNHCVLAISQLCAKSNRTAVDSNPICNFSLSF